MSWRPHSHARVNARNPEAWAKCDRCGSVFNLVDLAYQFDWAGAKLINKRLKVCSSCRDEPQEQRRQRRMTPDPVPVRDPRPLNNAAVMGGYAEMLPATLGHAPSLSVIAPSADVNNGYPGSPFSTAEEEETAIPVSIDPP